MDETVGAGNRPDAREGVRSRVGLETQPLRGCRIVTRRRRPPRGESSAAFFDLREGLYFWWSLLATAGSAALAGGLGGFDSTLFLEALQFFFHDRFGTV